MGAYLLSPARTSLSDGSLSGPLVRRRSILFVSHRWYSPGGGAAGGEGGESAHPDDAENHKLEHIKALLRARPDISHVWMDFFSIPQENRSQMSHVINALPFLVRLCGVFVAVAKDDAGLDEYHSRGWCLLEQLCAMCPYHGARLRTARLSSTYDARRGLVTAPLPESVPDPVRAGTFTDDAVDKPDEQKDRERVKRVCERVLAAIREEHIGSRLLGTRSTVVAVVRRASTTRRVQPAALYEVSTVQESGD